MSSLGEHSSGGGESERTLPEQLEAAISSGDESAIRSTLEEMCTFLCVGGEAFLRIVDANDCAKKLLNLLDHSSSDIRVLAARSIALLLDVSPRAVNGFQGLDVVPRLLKKTKKIRTDCQRGLMNAQFQLEEHLKAFSILSLHFYKDMMATDALPTLVEFSTSPLEALCVPALDCVVNLFSVAMPQHIKSFEPALNQLHDMLTHHVEVAAALGTAAVNAAVRGRSEEVITKVTKAYVYFLDRVTVSPTELDQAFYVSGVGNTVVDDAVLLLTRATSASLHRCGVSVLVGLHLASPTIAANSLLNRAALRSVCYLILDVIDVSFTAAQRVDPHSSTLGLVLVSQEAGTSWLLEYLLFALPRAAQSAHDMATVTLPFIGWQWHEDGQKSDQDESVILKLEEEYQRQRRSRNFVPYEVPVGMRTYTVDFEHMRHVSSSGRLSRRFSRRPIFHAFVHSISQAAEQKCKCKGSDNPLSSPSQGNHNVDRLSETSSQRRRNDRDLSVDHHSTKQNRGGSSGGGLFGCCLGKEAESDEGKLMDDTITVESQRDLRESLLSLASVHDVFLSLSAVKELMTVLVPCLLTVLRGSSNHLVARHATMLLNRAIALALDFIAKAEPDDATTVMELAATHTSAIATAVSQLIFANCNDVANRVAVPAPHLGGSVKDAVTTANHVSLTAPGEMLFCCCDIVRGLIALGATEVAEHLLRSGVADRLTTMRQELVTASMIAAATRGDEGASQSHSSVCLVHLTKGVVCSVLGDRLSDLVDVVRQRTPMSPMMCVDRSLSEIDRLRTIIGEHADLSESGDDAAKQHRLSELNLSVETALKYTNDLLCRGDAHVEDVLIQFPELVKVLVNGLEETIATEKPVSAESSSSSIPVTGPGPGKHASTLAKALCENVASQVGLSLPAMADPPVVSRSSTPSAARSVALHVPMTVSCIQDRMSRPLALRVVAMLRRFEDRQSGPQAMLLGDHLFQIVPVSCVEEVTLHAMMYASVREVTAEVQRKFNIANSVSRCTCSHLPGAMVCDFCTHHTRSQSTLHSARSWSGAHAGGRAEEGEGSHQDLNTTVESEGSAPAHSVSPTTSPSASAVAAPTNRSLSLDSAGDVLRNSSFGDSSSDAGSPQAQPGKGDSIEVPPQLHVTLVLEGVPLLNPSMTIFDALVAYSTSAEHIRRLLASPQSSGSGKQLLHRALSVWVAQHKMHFIVTERRPPTVNHTRWGCACSGPSSHTTSGVSDALVDELPPAANPGGPAQPSHIAPRARPLCSPVHYYRELCEKRANEAHESLGMQPILDQQLRLLEQLYRVNPHANKGSLARRKLNSAMLHAVRAQALTFAVPSLAPLSHAIVEGNTEGSIATYALWNYPEVFPFELRAAVLDIAMGAIRLATPKSVVLSSLLTRNLVGAEWLQNDEQLDFGNGTGAPKRRQKVKVSRERLLVEGGTALAAHSSSPLPFDVEFDGELGTGFGPTNEFFSSICNSLSSLGGTIWRVDTPALFPTPLPSEDSALYFGMLGRLIARTLRDGHQINLPLHPVFVRAILGHDLMAKASENMTELDLATEQSLQHIAAMNESDLEAASLAFEVSLPLGEGRPPVVVELFPRGSSTPVTCENAREYCNAVRRHYLVDSLAPSLRAIRNGISESFAPIYLSIFTPEEFGILVKGKQGRVWADAEAFMRSAVADHGYSSSSPQIAALAEVVGNWDVDLQREFLLFISGSDCLPFEGLNPPITIVKKDVDDQNSPARRDPGAADQGTGVVADAYLPTVNTCFHYLKLPPYSSKDVLEERVLRAIRDGRGSFQLS